MSVVPRLRELLDRHGANYTILAHPASDTARGPAHALHVPGAGVAKVGVIRQGTVFSLAVLPAHSSVDLARLSAALRDPVELATEAEIASVFPDCEVGAIPPFGALYGLKTYLDEPLTHERTITFPAGVQVGAIRMSLEEYRRVAVPVVLWLAESLAKA